MSNRLTQTEFLRRCIDRHGDDYDYSESLYIRTNMKVFIKHKACGIVFRQAPAKHWDGQGCPDCAGTKKHTNESFVKEANKIHKGIYDYSLIKYINNKTLIDIICGFHGIFAQSPNSHLKGRGCPDCGIERTAEQLRITREEFIARANKVHDGIYDYRLVGYINNHTDVDIICDIHGVFPQSPTNHLADHGCPHCHNKSEGKVKVFLEKYFPGLFINNKEWPDILGSRLPDFRSKELRLVIEYDGEQHFHDIHNRTPVYTSKCIDVWKAIKILRAGYSLIRIPYDLLNIYNWEDLLLPLIKRYAKPVIRHISSRGDRLYDEHKDIYLQYRNASDDILDTLLNV